ncbi:hypothetical protein [Cysteiniphilum marinum]|uniref:hypothetical protein n=1 Tax=Cysteiniphilum marinum TaxID=2774191 RepID=UPI0019398E5F|nr:hypothetical protein [Cysteiniphilum marinum]
MQPKIDLQSSKNVAMIKYAVELKAKQLCDLLQFEDETKIKALLISFVCSLNCDDIDSIIKYLSHLTMDIDFCFDALAFYGNKTVDDEAITAYLEAKDIAWNIKADRSDFYDEALKLKSKKMSQSTLFKISSDILIAKLENYLYSQGVLDGTILDMLMHIKYVKPVMHFDVKGLDDMPIIEQLKLDKALNQVCK